jgi:hypothetical protein
VSQDITITRLSIDESLALVQQLVDGYRAGKYSVLFITAVPHDLDGTTTTHLCAQEAHEASPATPDHLLAMLSALDAVLDATVTAHGILVQAKEAS